ncbi:hypothetical protein B9Z55_013423 [Caenorhabditis nigoni]|uniref:Uncharacterized protein n=1 Tax=Caenorhabditis nigoni TaxID=1611254 RepID=A0A2G5U1M3_9PELO|nr:hypothetical protein B9Z55_013423 [Caenorhabditis nigoni]
MQKILPIYLCLAIHILADISNNATNFSTSTASSLNDSLPLVNATNSSSSFDIEEQLAKITNTCLTLPEQEQLSGNFVRSTFAEIVNIYLMSTVEQIIGFQELRNVLGFDPNGNWTYVERPSKEEIAAALTIEKYYELKEQRSIIHFINYFSENVYPPAVAFFDKRIPAIRTIYRHTFEEDHRRHKPKKITDRKEVDRMIDIFKTTSYRIDDAMRVMNRNNFDCLERMGLPSF